MRTKGLAVLIFILSSCTLWRDEPKFVPSSEYALVTLSTTYVTHTSNELVYSATVVLLDKYSSLSDVAFLDQSNFSFSGNGESTISNFGTNQINFSSPEYSFVLLDQSGNYSQLDPHNLRSQMVSKYFEDCSRTNKFQAAGFSIGGILYLSPDGFTNSWQVPVQNLFSLIKLTGGMSDLYSAIDAATGDLSSVSPGIARNCLILTHANDQISPVSMASVLQAANAANVKINLTVMDSSINILPMAALATQTGGWLAICDTPEQMVNVVRNWDRLTSNAVKAYSFTVTLESPVPLASGSEIATRVNVSSTYLDSNINSAYLYVKIP